MVINLTFVPEKGIYEMSRDAEQKGQIITNKMHEAMANILFDAFSTATHNFRMGVMMDYGRSVGMLVTDKKGRAIVELSLNYVREEFYV